MLCSATALLGGTGSTTLAGRLFRLFAFLLILDCIFLDIFFCFGLLGVLRLILGRCLLSHLGLVLVGAPGARCTASTTFRRVARRSNRDTSHQAGNAKPCYEALYLFLVHVLTTFQSGIMLLWN